MISVQIDPRGIRELDAFLQAFPREGALAMRRAINKTLVYVQTHGTRAIAREHGVPLKALRRRRRVSLKRAQGARLAGRIWFGLNPIAASYLGTPRQQRRGARAGKHFFAGAFVARMPSGHVGIFKRADNPARRTRGRPATSSANLPIVEQTVALAASEPALRSVFNRAPERLRTVALQEIRFVLRGKG